MTCCRISDRQRQRFANAFSSPSVRLVSVKGNTFVLINSMAFEGDGCNMCLDAEERLRQITESLRCAQVCCFCASLSVSACNITASMQSINQSISQFFKCGLSNQQLLQGPQKIVVLLVLLFSLISLLFSSFSRSGHVPG